MTTGQFLTFYVGDEQFAAATRDVSEVFRRPKITRVPNGPQSLLGVTGLRGSPAPVISLARLLGGEDRPSPHSRLLLLAGAQAVGLTVDRVGALSDLPLLEDDAGEPQELGRLYRVEDAGARSVDLDALIRQDFARTGTEQRRAKPTMEDAAADHADDRVALLGFQLDGQAYGLSLDEVEEVVPLPATLAAIAQSDEAALGLTEFRGGLLPIVSLHALLGLEAAGASTGKVVVVRIGEARVGLAVDRLTAIYRVSPETIDAAPAALNRGAGTAQVEAICRLPAGAGLIALLSAERLFSDEKTLRILADGRSEAHSMATDETVPSERFVIFRLGEEEYGLPLAAVDEVVRLPETLARVPNAPGFIEGVLNLRGAVTPIIDQRRRFEAAAGTDGRTPRIVVTKVDGRQAGFIVDAVSEILPVTADQIEATSTLAAATDRLFNRIASLDGGDRLILLVEPRELLDRAERDLLAGLDAPFAQ